jgi:phosphoserine phosphatase
MFYLLCPVSRIWLKYYDWKVAFASGGFSYFADYLQDRLNLYAVVANDWVIRDKKLTGDSARGYCSCQYQSKNP